jgi:methyl-accepting chemotaxis protein
MRLGTKLVSAFGTVAGICAVVGTIGFIGLERSAAHTRELGEVSLPSVATLGDLRQAHTAVRAANLALLSVGLDPKEASELAARARDGLTQVEKYRAEFEQLERNAEEEAIYAELTPALREWASLAQETEVAAGRAWAAHGSGDQETADAQFAAARDVQTRIHDPYTRSRDLLARLAEVEEAAGSEAVHSAEASVARAQMFAGIGVFGGTGIAIACGVFFARCILGAVRPVVERARKIAEGDLRGSALRVKGNDELAELTTSVNQMSESLVRLISEVTTGATQVDAGSVQIAQASQSLAEGASEQASSLEEISASLEEMASRTQQNADHTREASTLSETSKTAADRAQDEMGQMSRAMGAIKESSSEVGKIIRVIDEIAFQTNLLALNAAVEAARAGEAGKGFAVVADEVRTLAQRSAEAARNTSAMIEEATRRADTGVDLSQRVVAVLEQIVDSAGKVHTILSDIASATGEQAAGIEQINTGVAQLDQVTQSTAGNSEELASSAEEMSAQVTALRTLVGTFRLDDARPAPARPAARRSRPAPGPAGVAPKKVRMGGAPAPAPKAAPDDAALATF